FALEERVTWLRPKSLAGAAVQLMIALERHTYLGDDQAMDDLLAAPDHGHLKEKFEELERCLYGAITCVVVHSGVPRKELSGDYYATEDLDPLRKIDVMLDGKDPYGDIEDDV